jgi:hypothetical protein
MTSLSKQPTAGPWSLNRMDSAVEFAALKGETLAEHEGYYRANSGAWIVTAVQTDEEGFQVGGPICEVSFKGEAKRGEAYKAPDPEGQANARLIAAAPELYAFVAKFVEHCTFDTLGKGDNLDNLFAEAKSALAKAHAQ